MDQIESAQQYFSAAELEDINAQFTLALMYANGLGGLTKDFIFWVNWPANDSPRHRELKKTNPTMSQQYIINIYKNYCYECHQDLKS